MDTHHVRAGQNYDGGRSPRRLAAVLLVAGVAVSFAAGALHPEGANANDHAAAFAECWAPRPPRLPSMVHCRQWTVWH